MKVTYLAFCCVFFRFFSKWTSLPVCVLICFICVKVVFVATANVKNTISAPLLDRMELIDLVIVIQQPVAHQNSPLQTTCTSSNGWIRVHIYKLNTPPRYTGWLLSGRESKNRFGVSEHTYSPACAYA